MSTRTTGIGWIARLAIVTALLVAATVGAPVAGAKKPPTAIVESVEVRAGTAAVRLEVRTTKNADLKLRINGRRVEGAFLPLGPTRRVAHLGVVDGLRGGANKIRVNAVSPFGNRADRARIVLTRSQLLANAGEDQVVEPKVGVGLGVAPPAGLRKKLRHRWRILSAPPGARPRLIDRSTPQPTLRADRRGTYVLRLQAQRRSGGPKAYDTVVVSAVDDPPIGAKVRTIAGGGKIEVGGRSYPESSSDVPTDELAWAVLDRATLAGVESGSVKRDDDGINTLWRKADGYASGSNFQRYLMIVSGRSGVPEGQLAGLSAVAKRIGAGVLSRSSFAVLRAGKPFSIIGIPGGADGSATVRFAPSTTFEVSGSISGYLMQNEAITSSGAHLYDFVSPEHPNFDTKAAGSSDTRNVIKIGPGTYTRDLPAGATAGFHLVAVEGASMTTMYEGVIPTNGSGISDRSRQAAAADQIKEALDLPGGPLVFLQTIGTPTAAGPEWDRVVNQLGGRLGANRHYLYALDGTTRYALIGREGIAAPPQEASTAYDAGPYPTPAIAPARLIGSLTRARDSKFIAPVAASPTTANPTGGLNTDLINLAYQEAVEWPSMAPSKPDTEVYAAARYIWSQLTFCDSPAACVASDVASRKYYWKNDGADWDLVHSRLASNVTYPSGTSAFSAATFDAVKARLLEEMAAVAHVYGYFDRLRAPFDRSAVGQYVDLKQIGDDIWKSVQRPADDDNSAYWGLMLASGIAKLGEFSPPPGSSAAAGISASFALFAFLSKKTGGTPVLGEEVKARASQLATEMLDRIDQSKQQLTGLAKLVVSDYGKLMAADSRIEGAWRIPRDDSATVSRLRSSARVWFYEALVPVAYPYLIRGNRLNARDMDCQLSGRRGWPNQPDDAQMQVTVGYDGNGSPIRAIYFFSRGIGGAMSPPGGIGDSMFAPLEGPKTGAGIEKMSFFTPQVFERGLLIASSGQRLCAVGYIPGEW